MEDSEIVLSVSDQSQLSSLVSWVEATQLVQVQRTSGTPGAGQQGALDSLTLRGGSEALAAALKLLPDFMRAKRADFTMTATMDGAAYFLDLKNVTDITETLQRNLSVY